MGQFACRSFICLLLVGVAFFTANLLVLQQLVPSPGGGECICEGRSSVARTENDAPSLSLGVVGGKAQMNLTKPLTNKQVVSVTPSLSTKVTPRSSNHTLAVVVPFRDRFEEMLEFVPHIHKFLLRQGADHQIWVINQVDTHRWVHERVGGGYCESKGGNVIMTIYNIDKYLQYITSIQ